MPKLTVGKKEFEFTHTAVNKDIHLFINGSHDPKLCPECIEPGSLTEPLYKEVIVRAQIVEREDPWEGEPSGYIGLKFPSRNNVVWVLKSDLPAPPELDY